MMKIKLMSAAAAGLIAAAITLPASAGVSTPAIDSLTPGSEFSAYHGGSTGDTVGWTFTVNQAITVTHLGIWIDSGGIVASHEAAIWNSDGSVMLTSNVVDPGTATTIGSFMYNPTAPVVLVPGEEYSIGAVYASADGDNYTSNPATISFSPDVNVTGATRPSAGNLGLAFPTEVTGGTGRIGPTFLYVIPTPGALALLGIAGLAPRRRRRA